MLTAVVIRESPSASNRVVLPLGPGTYQDSEGYRGLFIKEVEGLGPVEAEIHRSRLVNISGASYEGHTIGERNVVLTIGMDYNGMNGGSIQDIRRRLYQLLRPGIDVRVGLEFGTTASNLFFSAYVESIEPILFSEDPEVQLSLISMDSYMEGSLSDPAEGIFNVDGSYNTLVLNYEGDVPAGYTITLTNDGSSSVSSISLRDRVRQTYFTVSPISFGVGHYLDIVSSPDRRTILHRDNSDSIVDRPFSNIHSASTWPMLHYGTNRIGVLDNAENISYSLYYRELYLGV